MAVYRFRVFFEDKEDIYRDIEIKATQDFEDFHNAIQQAIGFDNTHAASFFTSDDHWRREEELVLREELMNDDDDDHPRRKKVVKKLMKKSKLADFIEDPHQKFVYLYDPAAQWTLLIELNKIIADDPKANYPRTVKTNGVAPRQYKKAVVPPPVDDEDADLPDDEPQKEKVFSAEEGYDEGDDSEEDSIVEGEDDAETVEAGEEGEEAAEEHREAPEED